MILNVDHIVTVYQTTDLVLIQDSANLISKVKLGVTLLQLAFQSSMHMDIDTLGFANLKDTPVENAQSEQQASTDAAGSIYSRAPHVLTAPTSRPSAPIPPTRRYVLVLQQLLSDMLKCLVTLQRKVFNIEEEVQPWVNKQIRGEILGIQMGFDSFEQRIIKKLEGVQSPYLEGIMRSWLLCRLPQRNGHKVVPRFFDSHNAYY